ncbi:MAG: hypothetical protein ACO3RV_06855 [Luteolibacter sp.]
MEANHGQTPIPLPTITDDPRWIGRFSREVRKSIAALRDRRIILTGKGGSAFGTPSTPCPFGRIIKIPDTDPVETGILGGTIHCGDQNWSIEPYSINLASDVDNLVWFSVSATVNTDDDGVLLLPGVDTGTGPPTWATGAYGSGYPSNTAPTVSSPSATVILPIGRLIVDSGRVNFFPEGCGNFTITHCAGTVGYTRA